ncbi:unnamed protein product [Nezara viridula]|uniref:lysozyme n=1 Tax=Nezara viridula TaxID=85310 RepID=A0A9P0HAE5_NEZVI|nr:unnamed protein product [Nezara viridula]
MSKNNLLLLMIFWTVATVYGRKFMKCELARQLHWLGLSRTAIPDWVCLIDAESHMQTDLVTGPLDDGSNNYGLFQINSKRWCGMKNRGGDCDVKCSHLLTKDIKKSLECAEIIFVKMGGFSFWKGWKENCELKQLPNLDNCYDRRPWKTTTIPNPRFIYVLFAVALVVAHPHREIARTNEIINSLKKFNVSEEDFEHYICIAQRSSGCNKGKKHIFKEEGYGSYGLFQVNSTDACSMGPKPGGICNVTCEHLSSLILDPQVECAVKLVNKFCFWKWNVWTQFCKHETYL